MPYLPTRRGFERPLLRAAVSLGIPDTIAVRGEMPFTALGQGRKRRLFWKNFTPATNHVATTRTSRKDLTARQRSLLSLRRRFGSARCGAEALHRRPCKARPHLEIRSPLH
jgi:hypothetical protein